MGVAKRSIAPNGQTVRRTREAKGWSVARLAANAGCSTKTIDRMERGEGVHAESLLLVAEALGVTPSTLQEAWKEPSAPTPAKVEIVLTISIPYDEFLTRGNDLLLNPLSVLLNGYAGTRVVSTAPGSTIVTLEMDVEQARALVDAFVRGRLTVLKVTRVQSEALGLDAREGLEEATPAVAPLLTAWLPPEGPALPFVAPLGHNLSFQDVELKAGDISRVDLTVEPAAERVARLSGVIETLLAAGDLDTLPGKIRTAENITEHCRLAGITLADPDTGEGCGLVVIEDTEGGKFALESLKTKARSHDTADITTLLPFKIAFAYRYHLPGS